MDTTLGFLVVGAVILVAIGVGAYSFTKRRDMSFEGVVLDKNMQENVVNNTVGQPQQQGIVIGGNNQAAVTHSYSIRVNTATGEVVSYSISSGMYETIKIGDRVSKAKGSTDIPIVSSGQPSALSQS